MSKTKIELLAEAILNMSIYDDIRTTSGDVVTGFHIDDFGNIILEVTDD